MCDRWRDDIADRVRCKPSWLARLPIIGDATAQAIYPYILLPIRQYAQWKKQSDDPILLGTLIHEYTHLVRQKKYGVVRWAVRYIFDRRFRYTEEMAAIAPQMHIYVQHDVIFDCEKRAQMLSSSLYLWTCTYCKALNDLQNMWQQLQIKK